MVTKLASKKIVAMVMGAWFLSSAMAHHLGGVIANLSSDTGLKSPTELVYENIESSLSTTYNFTISDDDKDDVMGAVTQGMKIITEDGTQVLQNNNDYSKFRIHQAADSCLIPLINKSLVGNTISETNLRQIVENSYKQGIDQYMINGKKAGEIAIEKSYTDKEVIEKASVTSLNSLLGLITYIEVFWLIGIVAFIASAVMLVLVPLLKRMMHGVN